MNNKKVAIVLGGTNPHIELVRQLQKMGYYVVLVDYLENPPAKAVADLHIKESTLDLKKVLDIAKSYQTKLIISACVDQANITACYVAEKMGLPKPYSYQLALQITNKGFMKKKMLENNIPTTRYYYLQKNENVADLTLNYPIMVKPADSCAASGVKKANNFKELQKYLNEAQQISRTGQTVIEEYFSGTEISAYCIIKNHKANIIMISERLSTIDGENQVLKCFATVTPPNISSRSIEKINVAANQIAAAFELDNTPLHVQAIVNNDDINIIEFAPRAGGGISYQVIRETTSFDIIRATIDSYLEKEIDLANIHKPNGYFSINLIYGITGIFDHIEGISELLEKNIIQGIHYHKLQGAQVSEDRASGGRIAAFLVSGDSKEEMCNKIKYAIETMDVYDRSGNKMMRKDLYLRPADIM